MQYIMETEEQKLTILKLAVDGSNWILHHDQLL